MLSKRDKYPAGARPPRAAKTEILFQELKIVRFPDDTSGLVRVLHWFNR